MHGNNAAKQTNISGCEEKDPKLDSKTLGSGMADPSLAVSPLCFRVDVTVRFCSWEGAEYFAPKENLLRRKRDELTLKEV